jgi:hypothetical protein
VTYIHEGKAPQKVIFGRILCMRGGADEGERRVGLQYHNIAQRTNFESLYLDSSAGGTRGVSSYLVTHNYTAQIVVCYLLLTAPFSS